MLATSGITVQATFSLDLDDELGVAEELELDEELEELEDDEESAELDEVVAADPASLDFFSLSDGFSLSEDAFAGVVAAEELLRLSVR
jgi:hypothetical protein